MPPQPPPCVQSPQTWVVAATGLPRVVLSSCVCGCVNTGTTAPLTYTVDAQDCDDLSITLTSTYFEPDAVATVAADAGATSRRTSDTTMQVYLTSLLPSGSVLEAVVTSDTTGQSAVIMAEVAEGLFTCTGRS